MDVFNKVPGKGSRTVLAVLLLVLVTIGNLAGIGGDSLSPELVESVQVVLAGLAGIFYRLKQVIVSVALGLTCCFQGPFAYVWYNEVAIKQRENTFIGVRNR